MAALETDPAAEETSKSPVVEIDDFIWVPGESRMPFGRRETSDRTPGELEELEAAINYIRPAVQADGGDIELERIEGDRVVLKMAGACDGCPMATQTLVLGVERVMKVMAPWVGEVVGVSDSGIDHDHDHW